MDFSTDPTSQTQFAVTAQLSHLAVVDTLIVIFLSFILLIINVELNLMVNLC